MGHRTAPSLLANGLSESHRCPLAFPTGTIHFREGFVAPYAPKPAFVQHQFDPMFQERHVTFPSFASIMLFDTDCLAVWAIGSVIGPNHFHLNRSIWLHLLLENAQSF